jgi:ABC-type multidrug transport system permease subunit
MLRVLLAKDLRRAWRNPLPWGINLALPLCITALIGLAFGGRSDSNALGKIHFAVVDEDDSALTGLLRGAANQREGGKYLAPEFLAREEALRQINDNKLSAVLIIPTNFTRNYFSGREKVSLELIKNPAESIHPAVLEELLGAVTTTLNALARNFQSEFPEWQAVFEGREDYRKVATLIERAGDKLKAAKAYVNPPLVSYTKEKPEENPKADDTTATSGKTGTAKSGASFNLFAYLLAGLSAMFLLFIASNGMGDLHREVRFRTFERYHTLYELLLPFVAGKVIFTVVVLLLSSAVMLGGGALIFRIHWQQPLALAVLTLGYAAFAAGLMAALAAVITDERAANVLNNIAGMALGLVGGCAFPPQNLPAFLRDHITPLMPSFWFCDTVRNLESGNANVPWFFVTLKLVLLGAVFIAIAVFLFRQRFKEGLRP